MKGYLSDREYDRVYSAAPRICVDLIIKSDNGVHLIKREVQPYKGKYHLPGGRVMFRESVQKAVQRIAKKEIGVKVRIMSFVGYMEFTREQQGGKKRHSISLAFTVKPLGTLTSETYNARQVHPVHYKFLKANKLI